MTDDRHRYAWVVVFAIVFGVTFWQIQDARHDADVKAHKLAVKFDEERAAKDLLSRRVEESTRQTADLIEQVSQLGETPVVKPDEVPPTNVPATGKVTQASIELAVADYFQRFPLPVPGVPLSTIRLAVSEYLTANPPREGRPPTDGEIAGAVARYLNANPPKAGADGEAGADGADGKQGERGQDGRSVIGVALDGCDLVFNYSSGPNDRVGPVCGPTGPAGPQGPQGERGPMGPAYTCPDGSTPTLSKLGNLMVLACPEG